MGGEVLRSRRDSHAVAELGDERGRDDLDHVIIETSGSTHPGPLIQEISARIGRVTGRGIAGNLKRHYPRPVLAVLVGLLLVLYGGYTLARIALGQQDTPDRLLIPEKLYGRAREVEKPGAVDMFFEMIGQPVERFLYHSLVVETGTRGADPPQPVTPLPVVGQQTVNVAADNSAARIDRAVGAAAGTAPAATCSLTMRHSRFRKRAAPSIPASLHSSDCSGGAVNIMNRRTASAP